MSAVNHDSKAYVKFLEGQIQRVMSSVADMEKKFKGLADLESKYLKISNISEIILWFFYSDLA